MSFCSLSLISVGLNPTLESVQKMQELRDQLTASNTAAVREKEEVGMRTLFTHLVSSLHSRRNVISSLPFSYPFSYTRVWLV